MKKLDIKQVRPLIRMAMEEDLGSGDVTTNLLFRDGMAAEARIVSREEIVVSGLPVIEEILRQYDERLKMIPHFRDGQSAHVGNKLATIRGPLRSMLSVERVMLNFLQRLSGIATTTSRYVRAIKGTKAKIYDTRKTLPGWRLLEKYAVRCGGGYNHRLGLYDGILIKDNHLAELGKDFPARVRRLVEEAQKIKGLKFIAVEVDHVDDQLNHVLKIPGIDIVLLDNMGQCSSSTRSMMRDEMCGRKTAAGASGNINLNNVSEIGHAAWTGSPSAPSRTRAAAVDITGPIRRRA